MRIALKINLVLLTLLSISTGLVKLAQMPEEMALFRNVGFTDGMTLAFGVLQLVGGVLLIPSRTRKFGAGIMIPTFIFATYALFASSIMPFAPMSLLFIAMAVAPIVANDTAKHAPSAA